MKKFTLLFSLILSIASAGKAQMNCNDLCVLNISIDSILVNDTMRHNLEITIVNVSPRSTQINYPIVQVRNAGGDTVANKNGAFYTFSQPGKDTMIHIIPTSLKTLPSGFAGTVFITDGIVHNSCSMAYPSICTAGVKEIAAYESVINIYPNPADRIINFELKGLNNAVVLISLYDCTGRVVKTFTEAGSFSIDCEGLREGIYFVSVTNGSRRFTSKLIISK